MTELDNHQPPRNAPSFEGAAIGAGCLAGCAMHLLQRLFFFVFTTMLFSQTVVANTIVQSPWLWGTVNISFVLATGAVVGFFTARRARHRKYHYAVIATVLFALIEILVNSVFLFASLRVFSVWNIRTLIWLVLSIPAALYGAYMAQSWERNRGVQIQ